MTECELIEIEQRARRLRDMSTNKDGEPVYFIGVEVADDVDRLLLILRNCESLWEPEYFQPSVNTGTGNKETPDASGTATVP